MLTPYSHSQFITKILTSTSGDKYKVVFLVALVDGKVNAQIVSSEFISKIAHVVESAQVCLPAPISRKEIFFTYAPSFKNLIFPFNSLFFYNSQPTRAPSF